MPDMWSVNWRRVWFSYCRSTSYRLFCIPFENGATEETEQNYMYGLRDSIPRELQGKLVIKVIKTKSSDLVDEARNLASVNVQYREIWIIFDRDKVMNFDEIIRQAVEKGISVGWTNPCIEEWFNAYFGAMPTYQDCLIVVSKNIRQSSVWAFSNT